MATQTLSYCTDCELECTAFPAFALLCVPKSIVAQPIFDNSPSPLVAAIQSVRESTCADPCGPGKFVYTIDYNDSDLQPGFLLTAAYIESILCDDCLIALLANLVNSLPTMIQEIILQLLTTLFLDTPSIDFSAVGSNFQADVNISADPGNCLVENPDGLYAPCGDSVYSDTSTVDFTAVGPNVSADVKVSADPGNCLTVNPDGLFSPCVAADFIQSISNTPTLSLAVAGNNLTGDVILSPNPDNCLFLDADGLRVKCLCVTDTASVDLSLDGNNCVSADVKISANSGNSLILLGDGLFTQPCVSNSSSSISLGVNGSNCITADLIVDPDPTNALVVSVGGAYVRKPCVNDSATINFSQDFFSCISGDVNISADAGNGITAHADGIYASTPFQTVADTPTIDLSLGAGILTAAARISADSSNLLEAHADGLWIPAQDGWIPFNVAATFVSATSFSVPGDWTDRIGPGDKVKITDTTLKFFSVLGATFGAGITTFSLTGGSNFTLSGGALTLPFFSHYETPTAWKGFFDHAPVFDGFSVDPSGGSYIFRVVGKFIEYDHRDPGNGVSDDTVYKISAPVPLVSAAANAWVKGTGTNNSIYQSDILAEMGGGIPLTEIWFSTAGGASAWTAANLKQARVTNLKYQYAA